MSTGVESEGDAVHEFDHDNVMEPAFRLEGSAGDATPHCNLYLQTFRRSSRAWSSFPTDEWVLLAQIFPEKIVMYPVHTNPHAQRYLRPKQGTFRTLVYQDNGGEQLPDSAEGAVMQIERRLPWRLFDECRFGLGFSREVDAIWTGLASLTNVDSIVVSDDGPTEVIERVVWLRTTDLDDLRRAFGRIKRAAREKVRMAKKTSVRNRLLAQLNPERFPPIVQVGTESLVEIGRGRLRQSSTIAQSERRSTVRAIRNSLGLLATEAPRDLLELHAEIERVTLASMISRYESMLNQSLSEARWQRFFEDNIFILTIVFARSVRLLHTQFHAQGSSLDGSGAQVGDFLFAERGQSLAIVEIKKPATTIMLGTPYRNGEVYGPSGELSGALTQVLYQQGVLHSTWLVHQVRPELRESRPDTTKCVVIAGMLPTNAAQLRSFEVFRNACKNVEIITFDELLSKLRLLLAHLSPQPTEAGDPIPF